MGRTAYLVVLTMLICEPLQAQVARSSPGADCHTTLFGGTTCTQHIAPTPSPAPAHPAGPLSTSCRFGSGAAARLICADPKLARIDSNLARAYRDAKQSASPDDQKVLATEESNWIQQRNQKCGLTGKDNAPLEQLQPAAQCMEDEIKARIDALQTGSRVKASDDESPCGSAKNSFARLVCADPDLADADLALSKALQEAEKAAPAYDKQKVVQEQVRWAEARDEKCGLRGKDTAPIDELRKAKPCIEQEMKARFVALAGSSESNLSAAASTSQSQGVVMEPMVETDVSGAHAMSKSTAFQALRFSAGAEGLKGTVKCSAPLTYQGSDLLAHTQFGGKWGTAISLDDDANTYRVFESDNWVPVLNKVRNVARSACAAALASGKLKNAANEPIAELYDLFEIVCPHEVFVAYSTGQNNPWMVEINAPKVRKQMKADLDIKSWADLNQLVRNPYFFKDSVVGVIMRFDRMVNQDDAVFARDGNDVLVTKIPPKLPRGTDWIVLAGRVKGNRGVVEPSGNEVLMPILDYVGAANCGNMCQALERLPSSAPADFPTAGLEK